MEKPAEADKHDKVYTIFIDGNEFQVHQESMTGAQLMQLGGIPADGGLILVLEDGTQVAIDVDEPVELKPGRRFKKAPRFVRG